jgi:4-nitrophenyl phosphatase
VTRRPGLARADPLESGQLGALHDHGVGATPTRVAHRDSGRDSPRGAVLGGPVEHELDLDGRWHRRAHPADDGRSTGKRSSGLIRRLSAAQGVEQVRAIHEEPGHSRQRVAIARHGRIVAYDPRVLLLVDLDGVVYRGSEPVPGVAAVLAERARQGDDVVYVTNNSMFDRTHYVTRLRELGAPADTDRVVSSSRATALFLLEEMPDARRVLAVGGGGLERELREVGLDVVTAGHAATRMAQEGIDGVEAAGSPDAVVVGLDPQLTYLRLAVAADCIRAGARFIATNRDPIYPTERGLRPGAGAIVAALEASTHVTPTSIGKPGPLLLELAAHAAGGEASKAVMIGDSLTTDLAAARDVGARMVLMLTGVTQRDQIEALPAKDRPDAVAADAAELAAALDGLGRG